MRHSDKNTVQKPLSWYTPEELFFIQIRVISNEFSNPILNVSPDLTYEQAEELKRHLFKVEGALYNIERLQKEFPVIAIENPTFAFMDGRKLLSDIIHIARHHLFRYRSVIRIFYKYEIQEQTLKRKNKTP